MSSEAPLAAALEAVLACDRLTVQLLQLAGWLERAASVARADWTGPHRETFDQRVAVIDSALQDATAALTVLRTRVVP